MNSEKKSVGRGRPKGPVTYALTVRVREDQRDILDTLACEWHCSASHAARVVLDEALAQRNGGRR